MFRLFAIACLTVAAFAQQEAPSFLDGAPAATVKAFGDMTSTFGDLTEAAANAKVEAWIAQQTPAIKANYAKFKTEEAKYKKEGEAARAAAIKTLSPAAKEADAKMFAISNNAALTLNQKGQQMGALMQSLPPNVAQELQKSMEGPK